MNLTDAVIDALRWRITHDTLRADQHRAMAAAHLAAADDLDRSADTARRCLDDLTLRHEQELTA